MAINNPARMGHRSEFVMVGSTGLQSFNGIYRKTPLMSSQVPAIDWIIKT
jgi:hypothetical protein